MRQPGHSTAKLALILVSGAAILAACTPGSGGATPQPATSAAPADAPAASVAAPAPSASGGKAGY